MNCQNNGHLTDISDINQTFNGHIKTLRGFFIDIDNKKEEVADNKYGFEIKLEFIQLGFTPIKPIREQEPNPLPDRKALDDIVFDILGLTED